MNNNIDQLFQDTALPADHVKVMRDAYAQACKTLHDRGQPAIVNQIIAERIVALAKNGERNPNRLSEGALAALGERSH